MHAHQLNLGRSFAVVFQPDEDFYDTLTHFCQAHGVRQGYIPMFIAAFAEAEIVGTCQKPEDLNAPVWSSVHVDNVEALGAGTISWDDERQCIQPHIHTTLGLKHQSATGFTSHLLSARTQFVVEMIITEITSPGLRRLPNPDAYDTPLLAFQL